MKDKMIEVADKFCHAVSLYADNFESVEKDVSDLEMINFTRFLATMVFECEALNRSVDEYKDNDTTFLFPLYYLEASQNYVAGLDSVPSVAKFFNIDKMKDNIDEMVNELSPINIEDMNEILDALSIKADNVIKNLSKLN